jgi:hypothetical protein
LNRSEGFLNYGMSRNNNNIEANLKVGMEQTHGLSQETPYPIAHDRIT